MKTAFFDLVCGAAGDMILASLIDAGAPLDRIRESLCALRLPGLRVDALTARRKGIRCLQMDLGWDAPDTYRHVDTIVELIGSAGFSSQVFDNCTKVLMHLAQAEAAVHGIAVEDVHFHEIGAVDTIVDVAGICLCLEALEIDRILYSDMTVGHGTVSIEHGVFPVPVPATAHMIRGLNVRSVNVATEILTPTGCAVLTALGTQTTGMPSGVVVQTGYGCGTRELKDYPNVLRTVLVEERCAADFSSLHEEICVLESDMDHVSGEVMAHAAARCMEKGALDVSWSPLVMKKSRPGYRMTVLCRPPDCERMIDTVMAETRTLGVRFRNARRVCAGRRRDSAMLQGHRIQEKVCSWKGKTFRKPEYDSLAAFARAQGRPLAEVLDEYMRTCSAGEEENGR